MKKLGVMAWVGLWFFGWLIFTGVAAVVGGLVLELTGIMSKTNVELASGIFSQLATGILVLVILMTQRTRVAELTGPGTEWRVVKSHLPVTFILMGFSLSVAALFAYGISRVSLDLIKAIYEMVPTYIKQGDGVLLFGVMFVVSVVLLAPITEEFLFRGVFYNRLKRRLSSGGSALYSSLLFALLHPFNPVGALFYGLMFCYMYEKTGNLRLPIIAHMIINLLFTLPNLPFITEEPDYSPEAFAQGVEWYGVLLFVTGPYIVYYLLKNWPKATESALPEEIDPPPAEPVSAMR